MLDRIPQLVTFTLFTFVAAVLIAGVASADGHEGMKGYGKSKANEASAMGDAMKKSGEDTAKDAKARAEGKASAEKDKAAAKAEKERAKAQKKADKAAAKGQDKASKMEKKGTDAATDAMKGAGSAMEKADGWTTPKK
jgi:hypothetical protein